MNKKKTSKILAFLAIILIIGGLYWYKILSISKQDGDTESLVRVAKINSNKLLAQGNIKYFVTKDSFQKLYNNKQYQNLKEVNTFLNLNIGVGNSNPFYNPNIIVE